MKVLYIAGAGRSGSTLLEMILGNVPGFFSIGEARFFWQYLQKDDIKCGCGNLIAECAFWSKVIKHLNNNTLVNFSDVAVRAAKVDRTRNMLLRHFPKNLLQSSGDFAQAISYLYDAIWEKSGYQVIVDSSKVPSHLYLLLKKSCIDIRVIHLVRDGRAVAYSWSKRQKEELAVEQKKAQMPKKTALLALLVWMVENLLTAQFKSKAKHYQVLRYEDFVKEPQIELQKTLSELELDGDLSILDTNSFYLPPTHSVGGNPIRFANSQMEISLHEEWRKRMRPTTKKILSAVGYQVLNHYNYI